MTKHRIFIAIIIVFLLTAALIIALPLVQKEEEEGILKGATLVYELPAQAVRRS